MVKGNCVQSVMKELFKNTILLPTSFSANIFGYTFNEKNNLPLFENIKPKVLEAFNFFYPRNCGFFMKNIEVDQFFNTEINEKKKIFVLLDAYECSWNTMYNVTHLPHCVIAVKNSETGLIIDDPYLKKSNKYMDYESLMKGFICAYEIIISPEKIKNITFECIRDELFTRVCWDEYYSQYDTLISYVKKATNIMEVIQDRNVYTSLAIVGIKQVAANYLELSDLMKNIMPEEKIKDISRLLENQGNKWNIVSSLLMKIMLKGEIDSAWKQRVVEVMEIMKENDYSIVTGIQYSF